MGVIVYNICINLHVFFKRCEHSTTFYLFVVKTADRNLPESYKYQFLCSLIKFNLKPYITHTNVHACTESVQRIIIPMGLYQMCT